MWLVPAWQKINGNLVRLLEQESLLLLSLYLCLKIACVLHFPSVFSHFLIQLSLSLYFLIVQTCWLLILCMVVSQEVIPFHSFDKCKQAVLKNSPKGPTSYKTYINVMWCDLFLSDQCMLLLQIDTWMEKRWESWERKNTSNALKLCNTFADLFLWLFNFKRMWLSRRLSRDWRKKIQNLERNRESKCRKI